MMLAVFVLFIVFFRELGTNQVIDRQTETHERVNMRATRLIGMIVVLCVGMAGRGDAQKRPHDRGADVVAQAQVEQQRALLNSLLDTFARRMDQAQGGVGPQCDAYREQVRQTALDVLLSPALASKLNAKLTADDIEDLKRTMSLNMVNAYYYGKGKQ